MGRIDLTGAQLDWVGTGWLVAENIIVTNRHVAREFAERKGDGFTFKMGLDGQMSGGRRFPAGDRQSRPGLSFKLVKPLHIEEQPGPDVAFFEVEMVSGDAKLAKPIDLAATIAATPERRDDRLSGLRQPHPRAGADGADLRQDLQQEAARAGRRDARRADARSGTTARRSAAIPAPSCSTSTAGRRSACISAAASSPRTTRCAPTW